MQIKKQIWLIIFDTDACQSMLRRDKANQYKDFPELKSQTQQAKEPKNSIVCNLHISCLTVFTLGNNYNMPKIIKQKNRVWLGDFQHWEKHKPQRHTWMWNFIWENAPCVKDHGVVSCGVQEFA